MYNQIFLTDAVLTMSMASRQGFEPGRCYSQIRCQETGTIHPLDDRYGVSISVDDWAWNVKRTLEFSTPYPGDTGTHFRSGRFFVKPVGDTGDTYKIEDTHLGFEITIPTAYLHNERFNIVNWYTKMLQREYQRLEREVFWLLSDEYANCDVGCLHTGPMPEQLTENVHAVETTWRWMAGLQRAVFEEANGHLTFLEVNSV